MGLLFYAIYLLGGLTLGAGLASCAARGSHAYPPAGDAARLLDGATTTLLYAFATWVAIAWALALAGVLTAGGLVAGSVAALAAGGYLLVRSGALTRTHYSFDSRTGVLGIVALLPVALWLAFVVWRGTVLPVYSHDALAYHFPKAVLLARSHGFHVFRVPEPRISSWPCDYELLLASVLLLTGSDALTATLSNLAFVALLLASARLAAVWWGGGLHVALTTVLTASVPLVILHSGLHKNDLLFAFYAVCACSAAGRWYARGCVASLAACTVATELAIGTKVNGGFLVVGVAVALALGTRKARPWLRPRLVLACAGSAMALALLLGAWTYLANLAVLHTLVLPPELPGDGRHYGAWSNLWRATYLLLAVPFSPDPLTVWNPWAHAAWWWPANDVWASHYGRAFTVAAVLLVPCIFLSRFAHRIPRLGPFPPAGDTAHVSDAELSQERMVTSLLALVAYALTMPMRSVPVGLFNGFGRYVVYVVPVVLAWTVPPLVLALQRRLRRPRERLGADSVLVLGSAVLAAQTMWSFGVNDVYAPFSYVKDEVQHPEDRRTFVSRNRAALAFDRLAPPDATCAIDVGFDTWVYPAYGRARSREVIYLPRTPADAPVPIPDNVDWVIVDRTCNVILGHPGFTDTGRAWRYFAHGVPTVADLKVAVQVAADPRFDLVYADPVQNQALFRRKGAKTLEPRYFP